MKNKVFGYARVSTQKQSIERQIRNIREVNANAIIFQEAFTGKNIVGRKEFNKLLSKVQTGDTIIFDSVSRMSRNAEEGYNLYMELYRKGVDLVFIKEPQINTQTYKEASSLRMGTIDTGDQDSNNLVNAIMDAINEYISALARKQIEQAFQVSEKEVSDLSQRTKEGLIGKDVGRPVGATGTQKKKADPAKAEILKKSRDFQGTLTDADMMKLLGLARNTYYKYKKELRTELSGE